MLKSQFPDVFQLPLEEKLQLLGELWESVRESPELIAIPAAQLDELRRRHAESLAHPERGQPWEEVRERLLSRYV